MARGLDSVRRHDLLDRCTHKSLETHVGHEEARAAHEPAPVAQQMDGVVDACSFSPCCYHPLHRRIPGLYEGQLVYRELRIFVPVSVLAFGRRVAFTNELQ